MTENQKAVEQLEFSVEDVARGLAAMRGVIINLPNGADLWTAYLDAQKALNGAADTLAVLYYALGEAE
tara:strand:+ start:2461 stop:2664 length:204 start_codon:yes stop_codon:yes gene_type:complete